MVEHKSICLVAGPLTARSGVYRSALELQQAAVARGLDWRVVLGVSSKAVGMARPEEAGRFREFALEPSGLGGVMELRRQLAAEDLVTSADVVVSLNPQADMALSTMSMEWVAFLRGKPWPSSGEAGLIKRTAWRSLETLALQKAVAVWSTTEILRRDVGRIGRRISLVPAGIDLDPGREPAEQGSRAVWAARFDVDKNPFLFLEALRDADVKGVMYGTGPLEADITKRAPKTVTVAGWVPTDRIWHDALVYVGTAHREAFGRSAVEAAARGIPVILSREFGCAELLVTKPEYRRMFVLDNAEPESWRRAISSLATDSTLWSDYASHVRDNASRLSIDSSLDRILHELW